MYYQIVAVAVTIITLILFIWGKIRYDFVALMALIILSITKVIDVEDAFKGFSHPAVITVIGVLIISKALIKTGAINKVVDLVNKGSNRVQIKILMLMSITAFLSAFMNNIGALALIVPVALKIAKDNKISPSKLLMPVSFASLLGGMITSIGTPPNLIISGFRKEEVGEAFGFFSFTPIGLTLTIVGILFISFIGFKLIPTRESKDGRESFNIDDFLFELVVTRCPEEGLKLKEFFNYYGVGINVVSIIRKNGRKVLSPGGDELIMYEDILIIKSMPDNVNEIINKTSFKLKGAKTEKLLGQSSLKSEDIALVEVVLRNDSNLIGRTAVEAKLRNRYNANLIAVARKGVYQINRLKTYRFQSGDVLLLQAPRESLSEMYSKMRSLPLASSEEVNINIENQKRDQIITTTIFVAAVLLSAFNVLAVQLSFALAALLLVLFKVVTPREFYESIEWPTVVMIGSLFVLGSALDSSGVSALIAKFISNLSAYLEPWAILGILMALTIVLANIINTTAATILMAPIAVSIAGFLSLNVDPFLMAVVVGASTSFLTPIAHQSNTLVMGPGGYKFSDYARLGLPLTILSLLLGIPLILLIWPF